MAFLNPTSNTNGNTPSRLEDYLNDKLQTFADLETLDSLLANVTDQQALLQKQLDETQQELRDADDAVTTRRTALQRKNQDYNKQAADIDRRLRIVTNSEASDDALRNFDASIDQLNRLDIATHYLGMLEQVDNLCKDIVSSVKSQPDHALQSYICLHQLSCRLIPLQHAAEGAAPHLVDFVAQSVKDVRQILKDSFTLDLELVLSKILWPKPDIDIPSTFIQDWTTSCKRLLTLQRPDLDGPTTASTEPRSTTTSHEILLPLEVMMRPLVKRFNFHFSGDKPTNKLDKPEYFLSHTLDLLNTYSQFISDYFQPILFDFFGPSDFSSHVAYMDANTALITAVLPMPRNKVFSLVPQLLTQPNLLSHLMHELMGFDTALRDEWHYTGGSVLVADRWRGLTWEILNQSDYFNRWLQVEKEFALARYEAIINDKDSAALDYDSPESNATKPTKGAIRVNDLLETVTERYRPLLSFSQKLRFLIDVQIAIFDRYHARLSSGLDAFLTMNSSLGRTVQGSSAAETAELQGVKGLDRLCRIFGSADYLEHAMQDWSDDVFFLDLWNELQDRVNARSNDAGDMPSKTSGTVLVAGPLSIAEIASKTSSTLAASPEDELDADDFAQGALFDETAGAYARLRTRSEAVMTDTIKSNVRESLRPYARNNPWSSLSIPAATGSSQGESVDQGPQSSSLDLNPILQTLSSELGFLARALGTLPLRRVARQVTKSVDNYVFDRVLMGNTFSLHGARQVALDIETLASAIDGLVGGRVGIKGMAKSLEARILLTLDTPDTDAKSGETEDNAWDEDGDSLSRERSKALDLWSAQAQLFENNQAARQVLEELGLEHLSETEAREIVRRRVELDN